MIDYTSLQLPLLFILYGVLAFLVIFTTNRASNHIDSIDQKTNVGSAFLGGILLAGVTSLPELVTSLVATVALDTPGLAFGNIFGSNLFNLVIIGIMDIIFLKHFFLTKINKSHQKTNLFVIILYGIILIPLGIQVLFFPGTPIFLVTTYAFSAISVIILLVYGINAKFSQDKDEEEMQEEKVEQTIRAHIVWFVVWAILLVLISIQITFVTDTIAMKVGLGASFAGALFLGVATSLPELTAVYTLVKLKNYNVAVGNIVGSNLFNLSILSVVDLVTGRNIYRLLVFGDQAVKHNVFWLLGLGLIGLITLQIAFKQKKVRTKVLYLIPSGVILSLYVIYLIISNV